MGGGVGGGGGVGLKYVGHRCSIFHQHPSCSLYILYTVFSLKLMHGLWTLCTCSKAACGYSLPTTYTASLGME